MPFTTLDLSRLEAASRTLISPLGAATPEAWLLNAGDVVRDLVGGSAAVLRSPFTSGAPFFSTDAPDVSSGVLGYVEEVSWDGVRFSDPVVDVWHRLRRQEHLAAWSWDINQKMVEARGLDYYAAPIVAEVLQGNGYHDFVGMMDETPAGEAMIWVLGRGRGAFPLGEQTTMLLSTLMPSLRAGLDALLRLRSYRHALDTVTEAVAAFDADGLLLHQNAALAGLLAADPERDRLSIELRALARSLRRLVFPRRGDAFGGPAGPPTVTREVRTGRGGYALRGVALPPDGGGFGEAMLVTVTLHAPPAPPTAEAVRARYGLTRREAEVALLLADGLPNSVIAERLFISPHTVRRHVEGVLGKLGLNSRAAVAMRLMGNELRA